jgi:PEP-utilizing family enzyme
MSVYRCRLKRRRAALRTAIDLVHEQLITPQQALQRIDGIDLTALVQISLASADKPAVAGIGASGGIAVGRAAFDSESAQRLAAAGEPVILMRPDTSTADVAGFAVAPGVVTSVGARTAHAGSGRAANRKAPGRWMQQHDDRRRRRPRPTCKHDDLGKRLDHNRRRPRQHLPGASRDSGDAARGRAC